MTFDPENAVPPGARIKVLGIGGGGGNAVNTMIKTNVEGVEFIAANTDVQALRFSLAQRKIQLGKELTKGLGAGADPDIGRDAALEDRHALQEALAGADMVFITAGMGGGTGTGGAAVAAQIARELGALTVGVVTKPFSFEGKRRRRHAEAGIARLQDHVDTLITIPNQRLLQVTSPDQTMIDAFRMADNVLVNAVKGISDIINVPGTVNVDFADVKTVMASMGMALMGIGAAEGPNRAVEAARQAISSPLLEDIDIEGATGILINITAGKDITLMEVNEACSIIQEAAHEDANIIFGAVIDDTLGGQIRVTVIATGFPFEANEGDIIMPSRSILTPQQSRGIVRPGYNAPAQKPLTRPTSSYVSQPAPTMQQRAPAPAPMAAPIVPQQQLREEKINALFDQPVRQLDQVPPPVNNEVGDLAQMTLAPDKTSTELKGTKAFPSGNAANAAKENTQPTAITPAGFSPLSTVQTAAKAAAHAGAADQEAAGKEEDIFAFSFDERIFVDEEPAITAESASETDRQGGSAHQINFDGAQSAEGDDQLDVPAFLRSGLKDLSLS